LRHSGGGLNSGQQKQAPGIPGPVTSICKPNRLRQYEEVPGLTVVSADRYTHFVSALLDQEVWLAEVIIGDNESFESALKRFTKRVQQDGILAEARRREHYEKPSIRRKKKAAAKRRKSRKASA